MVTAAKNTGVSEYFDKNTSNFLRFGGSSRSLAIRRGIWKDVNNFHDALNFVNEMVCRNLAAFDHATGKVIDLGCGVGGTIFYLARKFPQFEFTGLTISKTQKDIAEQHACELPTSSLRFLERDFENLEGLGTFHAAIAIESFVYASKLEDFLETVSKSLQPGGLLMIADDFLSERGPTRKKHQNWLEDFRTGWRLNALHRLMEIKASADKAGLDFVSATNLTSWIKLRRPRDRLISLLTPMFRFLKVQHPFFGNMIGGDALQKCLRDNILEYHFLVFRKK